MLFFDIRPSKALDLHLNMLFNNLGELQIDFWTLAPAVLDANTLLSLSSKRSCHNVKTTLHTINDTNKRCCLLALIATPCYATAKLPNQRHALLVSQQIVYKPRPTKPFRANPTNQSNSSASISMQKKKGYIRLKTSLPQNWMMISLRTKPTIPTSLMTSYKSTL